VVVEFHRGRGGGGSVAGGGFCSCSWQRWAGQGHAGAAQGASAAVGQGTWMSTAHRGRLATPWWYTAAAALFFMS
jgi:hypothetical protein